MKEIDDKHDWLPEELYSDAPLEAKNERPTDAEIAALWEFPVRSNELTPAQEKALAKEHAEREADPSKRVYVKEAKKQQMLTWLSVLDLRQLFFAMNPKESIFCRQLLSKFERYGVVGAKWITRPQYDWLKSLAGKYLTDAVYDGKIHSSFFACGQRPISGVDYRCRGDLFAFFKAKDAFRILTYCKASEAKTREQST